GYEFHAETAVKDIPREKLMVICTGCQGEPFAALPKIARGDHPHIRVVPGDTVIYSSRVIPGNEKRINYVQNILIRKGIEVVVDHNHDIHVSGHPARDELAQMYTHVKPHIAVPVHGEAMHIHEHAKFARSLQVPHAIEPYNGAVVALDREAPQIIGEVETGYVAIDGGTLLDIDSPVLRMRRRMQEAGVISVALAIDEGLELVAAPALFTPGSLDKEADRDLLDGLKEEIEIALEELPEKKRNEDRVREAARRAIRQVFKREVGKKPIILVELMRV
ncbi:MAG: MBL fold metallo-hydrolase RNA specificity domain-containing protein, partial [Rickettsiales bacterium]